MIANNFIDGVGIVNGDGPKCLMEQTAILTRSRFF